MPAMERSRALPNLRVITRFLPTSASSTRQHVCDRVGHRHGQQAFLTVVSRLGPAVYSFGSLPAGLGDTGQLAAVRHGPEADPAQAEPAVDGPRTPTAH